MTQINRNDWFKTIMKITESEWIKNPIIPNTLQIGQFNTPSIQHLLSSVQLRDGQYPQLILYVRKNKMSDDTYFDTSSLQLMNYNTSRPVMFQVASNFNCQENGSSSVNLRSGNFLTYLMSDSTQGPSAAGGAGVGAILRLTSHFKSPINLLEETSHRSQVIGGKLYASDLVTDINVYNVHIGLHMDVPANFNRSQFGKTCTYHEKGTIIDQVLTSTIIGPSTKHLKITKKLLDGAYMGTYLAAIHRQTEVLVLTLVGGGSFNNPYNLIMDAIVDAHIKFGNQGYLKKVIIPFYDFTQSPQILINNLLSRGYPAELINMEQY